MKYFLLRLIGPRPTFPQDMTEAERTLMQQHGAYWSAFVEKGKVIVFGPVADPAGAWGMAVLAVEDEQEARNLGEHDPVILAGIGFKIALLPMPAAIYRK
jgi:uncharacterized protein YciI